MMERETCRRRARPSMGCHHRYSGKQMVQELWRRGLHLYEYGRMETPNSPVIGDAHQPHP